MVDSAKAFPEDFVSDKPIADPQERQTGDIVNVGQTQGSVADGVLQTMFEYDPQSNSLLWSDSISAARLLG
ncbi:MAG: hypothetical protein EX271_13540, partial [Acidimicrobiales bacterium]